MIETVNAYNLDKVLPLIRQYQEFYQVADICDSRNREFFTQFGESNASGCQFLYTNEDQIQGFATVFFTYSSSITTKVAMLNDLYVVPSVRGKGVGRQLIEHCREFVITKGAARLQWLTAQDNHQAQSLYDSLDTNKSDWHFYTYT